MKFKYLLLLAASALILNPIPTISASAQITAQSRASEGLANEIYRQVNPAVVTVFAGREIGSGSIVSSQGLVITNNHVVRGSSGQVFVRTADGTRIPGQVISTDRRYDLALIQLSGVQSLPSVRIASSGIQPGQPVFAIGSPYGRPGVMTTGTFSAARGNGDLQSRVILRPGNSGGPLLNAKGEMVGINKAVLESSRGGNTGISIATSAEIARQFIAQNSPSGFAIAPPSSNSAQVARRSTNPRPANNYPIASIEQPSREYGRSPVNPSFDPSFNQSPNGGQFEDGSVMPGVNVPDWRSRRNQPTPNNRIQTGPLQNVPENGDGSPYAQGNYPAAPGGYPARRVQGAVVVPTDSYPDYRANPGPGDGYQPNYTRPVAPPESFNPGPYSNEAAGDFSSQNQAPAPSGSKLGVVVDSRTLEIQQVTMGSVAASSGLQVGDRLLGVNGTPLRSFDELVSFLSQAPSSAEFVINRGGRSERVAIRF